MPATEVIFVRVQPQTKAAIEAEVAALNKERPVSMPEFTMTGFVLNCIEQVLSQGRAKAATPHPSHAVRRRRAK